jgi:thioredoxin-related protein
VVVQLVIALVVAVAAVVVAVVIRSRTRMDAPTQVPYTVPSTIDRNDFDRPDAPWLVVAFSSATCSSCEDAWSKARLLESPFVAVQEVEVSAAKDLHERYSIDAVPMILLVDDDGDVRASFIGAPTAADLWAALAELREPGSTPSSCDHHQSAT